MALPGVANGPDMKLTPTTWDGKVGMDYKTTLPSHHFAGGAMSAAIDA
jgi:hypothetical protein